MDFAPYQDQSPETSRALSPPPESQPRRSFSPPNGRRSFSPALASPTNPTPPTANPWAPSSATAFGNDDVESGRTDRLNEFETSLPIRLDYEACLAYLLLPPAGGVLLLILERKSDYIPCMAILVAVHGHVRATSDILVVDVPFVDYIYSGFGADRILDVEGIPRCGYTRSM
ncbi:uncharacterized protein BP5553_02217 [Venustampulla echinocandica]|uniref:Uncharacterized protein n=1 Tax=Venustampulla echinocandica TaxID=2656787 RepID=A0A370U383_9HELO|nr:uncharacterized protein BP5553_02217 [Venustampulla echinocandica]RDL42238.1 hypothetical protein BP5553_02217 [Venustampulla echinocandica]